MKYFIAALAFVAVLASASAQNITECGIIHHRQNGCLDDVQDDVNYHVIAEQCYTYSGPAGGNYNSVIYYVDDAVKGFSADYFTDSACATFASNVPLGGTVLELCNTRNETFTLDGNTIVSGGYTFRCASSPWDPSLTTTCLWRITQDGSNCDANSIIHDIPLDGSCVNWYLPDGDYWRSWRNWGSNETGYVRTDQWFYDYPDCQGVPSVDVENDGPITETGCLNGTAQIANYEGTNYTFSEYEILCGVPTYIAPPAAPYCRLELHSGTSCSNLQFEVIGDGRCYEDSTNGYESWNSVAFYFSNTSSNTQEWFHDTTDCSDPPSIDIDNDPLPSGCQVDVGQNITLNGTFIEYDSVVFNCGPPTPPPVVVTPPAASSWCAIELHDDAACGDLMTTIIGDGRCYNATNGFESWVSARFYYPDPVTGLAAQTHFYDLPDCAGPASVDNDGIVTPVCDANPGNLTVSGTLYQYDSSNIVCGALGGSPASTLLPAFWTLLAVLVTIYVAAF